MDKDIAFKIRKFIKLFELVFDEDWGHSKEMMGVVEATEEQVESSKEMGLEMIEIISSKGTFLNPQVEDEFEDWGYRGELLKVYRELKKTLA